MHFCGWKRIRWLNRCCCVIYKMHRLGKLNNITYDFLTKMQFVINTVMAPQVSSGFGRVKRCFSTRKYNDNFLNERGRNYAEKLSRKSNEEI